MAELMPFVPMILGVAGGALAMLLAAWGHRTASVVSSIAGLSAGVAAAVWLATSPSSGKVIGSGGVFAILVVACLALGVVALVAAFRTLIATPNGPRVAVLAAFAASSAAVLSVALDLGVLFLSVEALALCGYGLVALSSTDRAREAAMKWFVQGSVSTALFIVGIAVLLSRTDGSLSYGAIAQVAAEPGASAPLAIGFVLVLAALAFKAGAFPFHSWMPDAFETAPPIGAGVLASAGKVAPIAAAVWLALAVNGATGDKALAVAALLSVSSIVFGNLAALRQRSLARMLAYSGVAQIGYALAGVALAAGGGLTLVFGMLYGLTSLASFVFIVALREAEPDWDGSISGLAGLSHRRPALAASLVAIMLSLTGIPLTSGFWGKFLIFSAASVNGYVWLAIAGMLGSVVSFAYYGGVLRAAYMDDAPAAEPLEAEAPIRRGGFSTAMTVVLAIAIVVIGVFPFVTGLGVFSLG